MYGADSEGGGVEEDKVAVIGGGGGGGGFGCVLLLLLVMLFSHVPTYMFNTCNLIFSSSLRVACFRECKAPSVESEWLYDQFGPISYLFIHRMYI